MKTAMILDDLYFYLLTEKVQCAADSFDLLRGPSSGERSFF